MARGFFSRFKFFFTRRAQQYTTLLVSVNHPKLPSEHLHSLYLDLYLLVKMRGLSFISAFLLVLVSQSLNTVSATSITRYSGSKLRSHYAKAHSLRDGHDFDSGEWHSVNVTDLGYKYDQPILGKRSSKTSEKASMGVGGTVSHLINDAWNGLKGIGEPQQVKITW